MSIGGLDPRASDGKLFVLPNIFPGEVLLNFTASGDKVTEPQERWGDTLFGLTKSGEGITSSTFRFIDGVFLAGGHLEWEGGDYGSFIHMDVWADASTVKSPSVPNQGNCNLVSTGLGFNMIVPALGDGQYDLDYAAPVPATDDETGNFNGYWNYSEPWLGKGVTSPGDPGASKYCLYDAETMLVHFCKIHLMRENGARDLIVPSIKPKWVLPEWKIVVEISNASNSTLKVVWDLLIARRKTTT